MIGEFKERGTLRVASRRNRPARTHGERNEVIRQQAVKDAQESVQTIRDLLKQGVGPGNPSKHAKGK